MPPVSHPSGPFSSFLMAILVKSPFKVGALFDLWTPEESECNSWAEHSIRNKIDAPETLNTSPSLTLSVIVLWHFWMPNRNASFSGAKTYKYTNDNIFQNSRFFLSFLQSTYIINENKTIFLEGLLSCLPISILRVLTIITLNI